MVLKFKDGITPEDVILEILQAPDTTIILLSETHQIDKPKEIGIVVFVLQITFAERFKDAFDRSGLPLSSDKVIILKFFVYNDNPISGQIVDNEVNTQTRLALQETSQQICPSVVYDKDITGDIIDNAIYDLLHNRNAIIKVSSVTGIVTNEDKLITMYAYILSYIKSCFPTQETFDILKKKAFFMEFFSCKSLRNFCDIPQYFAEGQPVTSIDGIPLTIGHTPNTPNLVLGLDNRSFKTMALHYVTLKLFKLNCIHGDLHASNVYVLLDGTNIVFLVIDFGNGKIDDNLRLKLYKIPVIQGYKDYTPENKKKAMNWLLDLLLQKNCFRTKDHAIYLTSNYLHLLTFSDVADDMYKYIKILSDNKRISRDYFKAAIYINMCVEINSYFPSTFSKHIEVGQFAYASLYSCYKDLITEQMCNQIIEQCLYPIIDTKPEPKRAKTTGGGFIYKNRINKFIASKQINNKSKKSKKSKKRKNKTINRKKSRKITRKKLQNRRQK